MHTIDLGEEVKINVKVGGQSYELREPTQADLERLQKAGDDPEVFNDFVSALGMPRDVVEGLGVIRLKKLADGLTGALTEKK